MKRWIFFLYGVFCHLLFLVTFAWLAGFVGNLVVPNSIDSPPTVSLPLAAGIDLGLIALFGLQHSVMARPAFKRMWTRLVPQPIERSTYVLFSCLVVFLLVWQWQGIDVIIWDVQDPVGRTFLWGLFAVGWLLVPAVSLMISHFDLFGTRQVWLHLVGREYTPLLFRTPMLYRHIRHPLYLGWAVAFWAAPTMTLGHLLFAGGMTLYMAVAVRMEERDLTSHFGKEYEDYQQRVPLLVPRLSLKSAGAANRIAVGDSVSD